MVSTTSLTKLNEALHLKISGRTLNDCDKPTCKELKGQCKKTMDEKKKNDKITYHCKEHHTEDGYELTQCQIAIRNENAAVGEDTIKEK